MGREQSFLGFDFESRESRFLLHLRGCYFFKYSRIPKTIVKIKLRSAMTSKTVTLITSLLIEGGTTLPFAAFIISCHIVSFNRHSGGFLFIRISQNPLTNPQNRRYNITVFVYLQSNDGKTCFRVSIEAESVSRGCKPTQMEENSTDSRAAQRKQAVCCAVSSALRTPSGSFPHRGGCKQGGTVGKSSPLSLQGWAFFIAEQ